MNPINLFRRLQELQPAAPVLTGTIASLEDDGRARVTLTGGGTVAMRNPQQIAAGGFVFVQGGAVIGVAPAMPLYQIEI